MQVYTKRGGSWAGTSFVLKYTYFLQCIFCLVRDKENSHFLVKSPLKTSFFWPEPVIARSENQSLKITSS